MSVMSLKKNHGARNRLGKDNWKSAILPVLITALSAICVALIYQTIPVTTLLRDLADRNLTPTPLKIEYVGRVVDITNNAKVKGAEVVLEFAGIPQIRYTDSEGIYSFVIEHTGKGSGKVIVRADGFDVYERIIELPPTAPIEDIRLTPQSATVALQTPTDLPSGIPNLPPTGTGSTNGVVIAGVLLGAGLLLGIVLPRVTKKIMAK